MEAYLWIFGVVAAALIITMAIEIPQRKIAARLYEKEVEFLRTKHKEIFERIDISEYYTTGHPYVWVKTNLDEVLSKIKILCRAGPKGVPTKPVYFLSVNSELNKIYFVPSKEFFDLNQLQHYDEWLVSQKKYAKHQ